jgi:predicted metallo-beta-lactamase superfamily hydrolase
VPTNKGITQKTKKTSIMTTQEIFAQGYGKIKTAVITEYGCNWVYENNPNMSQSQRKKAPVFCVEASNEERKQAYANRTAYELANKEITILDFAKKVCQDNNGKIIHKSKSGSVYINLMDGKTVRVSDHFILDRDALNPVVRHDFEIVQKSFTANCSTELN